MSGDCSSIATTTPHVVAVEPPLRMRVADLLDLAPHLGRNVDVRLRRDLARDDHESCRDQRLAGDATAGSSAEHGVEDRVRDLVATLSGWPSVTDSEVNRNSLSTGAKAT
jgi:hypothetical protein